MINRYSNIILSRFLNNKVDIHKHDLTAGRTLKKTLIVVISTEGRNLFTYIKQRFLSRRLLRNDKFGVVLGYRREVQNKYVCILLYATKLSKYTFLIVFLLLISDAFSQSNRSTLNKGVDKYEEKKYTDAEVDFRKVVESLPKNFEANFNLGTSYYKQGKYDDAIKSFSNSLESAKNNESRAKVFHNIGNSLLKSNKVEQSVEAYKNALKFNPNDDDTKYNLSYALEMLKNKDKNQKNKNDKNDQKKDDQQKQQNQDQQNKDQNKQDQQQNPQPKDQDAKQDNTKQQQQPKEQKISKDEAQRILDALKNNEKDLQKLLRKKTGRVKKTDKDW